MTEHQIVQSEVVYLIIGVLYLGLVEAMGGMQPPPGAPRPSWDFKLMYVGQSIVLWPILMLIMFAGHAGDDDGGLAP